MCIRRELLESISLHGCQQQALQASLGSCCALVCKSNHGQERGWFARALTAAQIKAVASKSNMKAAAQSEEVLQDSLAIASAVSSVERCLKPLGQLFVRVGLKLASAEKRGREGKHYTMGEIRNAFLDSMGKSWAQQ